MMKRFLLAAALLGSTTPLFAAPIDQVYTAQFSQCGSFTGTRLFLHIGGDDEALVLLTTSARGIDQARVHETVPLGHQDYRNAGTVLPLNVSMPPQRRGDMGIQLSALSSGNPVVVFEDGNCQTTMAPGISAAEYSTKLTELAQSATKSAQDFLNYLKWTRSQPPVEAFGDENLTKLAEAVMQDIANERSAYMSNVQRELDGTPDPALLPVLREILELREDRNDRSKHLNNLDKAIKQVAFSMKLQGKDPRALAATTPDQICANRAALDETPSYTLATLSGLPIGFWDDALHERYLTMKPECAIGEEFQTSLKNNLRGHRAFLSKFGWLNTQLQAMYRAPMTLAGVEAAGFYAFDAQGLQSYAITSDDLKSVEGIHQPLLTRALQRLREELVFELRAEMPDLIPGNWTV